MNLNLSKFVDLYSALNGDDDAIMDKACREGDVEMVRKLMEEQNYNVDKWKDEEGKSKKSLWPPPEGTAPPPPEEDNPFKKLLLDVSETQATLLDDYLLLCNRINLHRCSDYTLATFSPTVTLTRMWDSEKCLVTPRHGIQGSFAGCGLSTPQWLSVRF